MAGVFTQRTLHPTIWMESFPANPEPRCLVCQFYLQLEKLLVVCGFDTVGDRLDVIHRHRRIYQLDAGGRPGGRIRQAGLLPQFIVQVGITGPLVVDVVEPVRAAFFNKGSTRLDRSRIVYIRVAAQRILEQMSNPSGSTSAFHKALVPARLLAAAQSSKAVVAGGATVP